MYTDIDFTTAKVRAYCRKSSEQDERQALSIESQNEIAQQIANEFKIPLKPEDFLSESKSAKKSYSRPIFEKLIKDVEAERVEGIISWHPDRIARNAGDAGRLVDLFDEGKLKFIITRQQTFRNTPSDKFFFTMMCSQAKMENDNKGINVMRGLVKKRKMGHPPGVAKVGYMNDKGEKGYRRTLADPDRIELVRQVFRMYLTGKYSAGELYSIAINEIGLTTLQRKREGGKPVKKSQFYRMLKDPYYAGFFFGKDDDGKIIRWEVSPEVPRVITEEEHKKAVALLGRRGICRAWTYTNEFPYKKFSIWGLAVSDSILEFKHAEITLL